MDCRTLKIILVIAMGLSLASGQPAVARTVKDQLGRRVDVPDEPRRVVALAPNITEIVFALGQEDRLKGVTTYSDFPPAATMLPKVGSYIRLDLERIVALKPDLCIAVKDGNPKETVQRLELLKIPVYAVDPRNLETVMQTVMEIGRLLNAGEKASTLLQNMRSRILKVQSLVAKSTYRPRVFFQIGIDPIVSIGTDTFIHELIILAGGQNLAAGAVTYPRFSQEQVLALSPEVFIITSMTRAASFEDVKAGWSRWPDMPAVRNQRILLEDSNIFDRPTPRLVDALELLVRRIHPELFKEAE
jgi:iron complex transport system substrate-binding protein